jgi:hypothetical protein
MSPLKRLKRRLQGSKKAERTEPGLDVIGMPVEGQSVTRKGPMVGPPLDQRGPSPQSKSEKTLTDDSEPAQSLGNLSNGSVDDGDESSPYLHALGHTEEAIQRLEEITEKVEDHWNALFRDSSDINSFGEHLRAFEAAVEAGKDTLIEGWRAYNATCRSWEESGPAWNSEHKARMEDSEHDARMAGLFKSLQAAESAAKRVLYTDLSSLDCYRLPFLRQDEHLIDDLDALVRQFALKADPALAAYQRFYAALAAVSEAAEAVAHGLAEMPRLFKRAAKYSELNAFFEMREGLGAAWERMQTRLQEAEEAVKAYGRTIAGLKFGPKDADIAQRWQEQYQADDQGFAALIQSLEEEHLSLHQEYVAPSHEDLMIRLIDHAMQGKVATPKGSAEEALGRAEGLSVALRVDAKLPRELWARLLRETDEELFETQLEALVGERHWINGKLDILRGRTEKAQAVAVTDEDKTRLDGLHESVAATERGLPPLLDRRALLQTAFIKAHPQRIEEMVAKLKRFEQDYVADEADANDGDGDSSDPIHEIYEHLSTHYVALRKGEVVRMEGRLLEKAYENVRLMAPGSVAAFLSARKAFDRYWVPHAYAHQALQTDFSALREAIKHVDPARQLYWRPIVESADALLQPEAFAALIATAKKCTLPALMGHFKDVLIPGRHDFLGRFRKTQQVAASAEAALAEVQARRKALLSTAKDNDVVEAARAFAEAGSRLIDILDSAFESLQEIGKSDAPESDSDLSASMGSSSTSDDLSEAEDSDAITTASQESPDVEEDAIDEVVFSLDKEAVRLLEERLLALEDAVEETCIVTEEQLAAIPGVQGNGRLYGTVRSILEIAGKH